MKKSAVFLLVFLLFSLTAMAENSTDSDLGYNASVSKEQVWKTVVDMQVHEVMIIDVTDKGDACGVSVDGNVQWIDVGDSKRINGVYIKVFEAYPVHSQLQDTDTCKLFIGGAVSRSIPFVQEIRKAVIVNESNGSLNISEIPAEQQINCTGCLKEELCYVHGSELDSQYCASSGNFESKKQYGSECANDYECLNFLCIKNTCRMETVWDKIANFFRNLFRD